MPSILPQLIVNGLIAGSMYALAASGFSLVHYVLKFFNFAQGALIGISAYLFFLFFSVMGLNYVLSIMLCLILSVLISLLLNNLIYKRLRKRKATNVVLMISSLALMIFSSSLILAVFGSSTKVINSSKFNKPIVLGFFTITKLQIAIILASLVLFMLLWIVIRKTRSGKAMRALADNKEVAQVVGINPEKIYRLTFAIAGIVGAIAGILIGLEQNLYPQMGVPMIVKGFISSVIGGMSSVPGSIIGGFFIGLVENVGIWFLPSGYKDAISFTILLLFLLLRPQGIFGVRTRDDN